MELFNNIELFNSAFEVRSKSNILENINNHILTVLNNCDKPEVSKKYLIGKIEKIIEINNYNATLEDIVIHKDKLVVQMTVEDEEFEFIFPNFEKLNP